jgi:hypothetical protein
MAVESPRIRSLLRQADSVADSGKRAAAEQLYRQIIDEAPDTAQAWYGLAQVVSDPVEKEAATGRAVALNPEYGMIEEEPVEAPEVPAGATEHGSSDSVGDEQSATFSDDGRPEQDDASATHGHAEVIQNARQVGSTTVAEQVAVENAQTLVCANHPGRNTHLRCNRCGKPICSSCANATPVGYRCPECIREQEDVYFTATPVNYLLAALVALPLSLLAGWLATLLGFWSIFLAAFAGTLIGRVAFRAAGRRRGRWLPHMVTACVILGAVLPALPYVAALLLGQFSLQLLFTGIYIVMATGATYYQMR